MGRRDRLAGALGAFGALGTLGETHRRTTSVLAVLVGADNSIAGRLAGAAVAAGGAWKRARKLGAEVAAAARRHATDAEDGGSGWRWASGGDEAAAPAQLKRVLDAFHAPLHTVDPRTGRRLRDAPHAWREPPAWHAEQHGWIAGAVDGARARPR